MAKEAFISEALKPIVSTVETSRLAAGEPALPREFIWRDRRMRIVAVRRRWKETGPCRHGSGERYVRKHWYEVVTASDGIIKIYFERQIRGGRKHERWWLFTQRQDRMLEAERPDRG